MRDTFKHWVLETVALVLYTALVSAVTVVLCVLHFTNPHAPTGYQCFYKINSHHAYGVEKVCAPQ